MLGRNPEFRTEAAALILDVMRRHNASSQLFNQIATVFGHDSIGLAAHYRHIAQLNVQHIHELMKLTDINGVCWWRSETLQTAQLCNEGVGIDQTTNRLAFIAIQHGMPDAPDSIQHFVPDGSFQLGVLSNTQLKIV